MEYLCLVIFGQCLTHILAEVQRPDRSRPSLRLEVRKDFQTGFKMFSGIRVKPSFAKGLSDLGEEGVDREDERAASKASSIE